MKFINLLIIILIPFLSYSQDTKPDYSDAQLDSIIAGTKKVDIPTHFNSNGDRFLKDIDVKSLVDKIKPLNNNWSLIGNSGTSELSNFMGTNDTHDVIFKANNNEVLRLEHLGLNYIGYSPKIRTNRDIQIGTSTNGAAFLSLRKEETRAYEVPGIYGFHGFEDYSNLTMTGANNAYASLALSPILSGSANYEHFVLSQLWGYYQSTGSINRITGVDINVVNNGGNATEYAGIRIANIHGTGTVTNNYGIYLEAIGAGVNNYAIYSAGGKCLFSDDILVNNGNFILNTTGKVFENTSSQSKFGAANGIFSGIYANAINTGLSFYSGGRFNIGITNGSPVFGIENNGNVRIGDGNIATERLDVVGNIKSTSLVGIGNRMVTADVNGVLSATTDITTLINNYNLSLPVVTAADKSSANALAPVPVGYEFYWKETGVVGIIKMIKE